MGERKEERKRFLTKLVQNSPRSIWFITLFPQEQAGEWGGEWEMSPGGTAPSVYTSQGLKGDRQLFFASCVQKRDPIWKVTGTKVCTHRLQ